jgi:hydrogenase maturation protein HypF
MIASLKKFERFGHLAYYDLPGADRASKEAIRPLLSLLKKSWGKDFRLPNFDWLFERIKSETTENSKPVLSKAEGSKILNSKFILEQIEKRINCVQTSSLGRVFDAVAAMIGLGSYNHFDAQLPMALEAVIESGIEDHYDFELVSRANEAVQLDLGKTLKHLIADVQKGLGAGTISAKFHNTLAIALLAMAKRARESTKLDTAALSGGVFCNRYLTDRLVMLLRQNDFRVLFNCEVPANDGGISLGQAAIAANVVNRIS